MEPSTLKRNDGGFVAQEFHTDPREQLLRAVFGLRVDFVVAVATVDAKRRGKAANFFNAFFERVRPSGDEISGDNSEVSAKIVGHVHSAANLRTRHIAAHMDVAKLSDLHSVESGGE